MFNTLYVFTYMKRSSILTAGVFIVSCLLLVLFNQAAGAQTVKQPIRPSGFQENRGQWSGDFSFRAKNGKLSTWITSSGLVFDLRGANIKTGKKVSIPSKFRSMTEDLVDEELTPHHAIRVDFVGAHAQSFETGSTLEGNYNYFSGSESQWIRNAQQYENVVMKNVYNGIDALIATVQGAPQYNFIVNPGADARQIVMNIDGANSVQTNSAGELIMGTSCGDVRNGSIYAYQVVNGEQRQVACRYNVQGTTVRFDLANYDTRRALVIDPIVYASFIGGDDLDVVTSSRRIEGTGELVVVGYTTSSNFPKTSGSYTTPASGAEDAFVIKYDAKLSKMIFCTYVGGASSDKPWDVALARNDQTNDIIVVGETNSANFPTKSGSYKQAQQGLTDVFVFRMLNNGTDLKFSTYFGGANGDDRAYSLAISASNQVVVCGSTTSTNMPTSAGVATAFKTALGRMDGFLFRLSANGGALEYSLYFGGNSDDRCTAVGMSINKDNIACIVGETSSGNLPLYPTQTSGMPPTTKILAPQKTMGGVTDCFFAQFNSTAAGNPVYSTYFGGNGTDFPTTILVDNAGAVTLGGGTNSSNLSQILNYQSTKHAGQECLLGQINSAGQAFTMTAYFGGNGDDVCLDMDTDDGTNLFLVGRTGSSDLPTIEGVEQQNYSTGNDGFIAKIGAYINMRYCSYLGTKGADSLTTISVVDKQSAYIGGIVAQNSVKTTDSAAQKTSGGGIDGYLAKWTFSALSVSTPATGEKKCAGLPLAVNFFASAAETEDKYTIEFSSNNGKTWTVAKKDHASTTYNWGIPANQVGGTEYRIRVTNQITGYSALNPGAFTVQAAPAVSSISPDTAICNGESVSLSVSATGDNLSYQWRRAGQAISGATNANYTISAATAADSAAFDCVVSGACTPAKTSSPCFVRVLRGATVTKQPSNVSVNAGKQARFEVVAAGKNLTYRWQFNGENISGANASFYEFFAQDPDKGKYRCIVTGDCGSDTSDEATLDISTSIAEESEFDGSLCVIGFAPNPVSDLAHIRVHSINAAPVDFVIVNEAGQIVAKGSGNVPSASVSGLYESQISLNTSQLASGSYKLLVSSADKRVFKNFVVQR